MKRRTAELERLLARVALEHSPAALASSLSAEDMVLTDAILRWRLDIEIFTLDTGRLHADTLNVIEAIRKRYGYAVRVYSPDPKAVGEYVVEFGRDAFYGNVELRKRCCHIRKVEPLERALKGKEAWITGQRREQVATRAGLNLQEYDATHGMVKFNPLADWTEDEVWAVIRTNDIPYNGLHDQGYRSIGCAPCTRPTVAGEDARAGRWWWEQPQSRECGLHLAPTAASCVSVGNGGSMSAVFEKRRVERQALLREPTSIGSNPRRSISCARLPASARIRCCSSPAGRIRSCCCVSRKRPFAPRDSVSAPAHRHRPQLSRGDRVPRRPYGRAGRAASVRSVEESIRRGTVRLRARTRAATPRNR